MGRRQFLRLMGASLALAGVSACTKQPAEAIVPYVRAPEEIVPGRPLFFATAVTLGGYATGCSSKATKAGRRRSRAIRSTRPAWARPTSSRKRRSGPYDPDRSQTLTHLGDIRTWSAFLGALRAVVEPKRATRGAGMRILTETVTSPTLAAQIREFLAEFPAAVASVRAAGRDQVAGRREGGFRRLRRDAVPVRQGEGHRLARRRFPWHDARVGPVHPRFRGRPPRARTAAPR